MAYTPTWDPRLKEILFVCVYVCVCVCIYIYIIYIIYIKAYFTHNEKANVYS